MKRKTLLSLVVLFCIALTASSEVAYALRESFEGGQLPSGWTQEYVAGQQDWVVESQGLVYPVGAADGEGRIALRNTTSQTIGYTTRLVTPVMDLTEIYQPILVFQHAQQQRTGDVDQLRVLYRSGADRDWVELKVFDQKIANWKEDTIELDAVSKTYQIAFEVTDNFGRGVVLDNVRVRPMPTCADPSNLLVEGLTTSSFRLRWNGSLDTDSFEVLLNKSPLDPDIVDEDQLWMRKWVNPAVSGFLFETGDILERNTYYYVYLRAYCSGEFSQWAGDTIRTQNIVNVPYELDFNTWPYTPGTVMGVNAYYWTKGTDIESNAAPFININEEPGGTSCKQKSWDGTHCLVFAGANSTTTGIPAGKYVYGATPELNVENVQNLIVSFMGTAYQYYENYNSKDWASSLIVGVMTDPADIETFVAIDTIKAEGASKFHYYQVPLSSYTGNGKYVAFLSRFDKDNLFYIDNLTIASADVHPILPTFDIKNVRANSLEIVPELNGASSWDIVIALNSNELTLQPQESKIIYTKTGITAKSFVAESDEFIDKSVQVYIRANGVYALPERVLMPKYVKEFPFVMSFKAAESTHTMDELRSNYLYGTGTSKLPSAWLYTFDTKKYGTPNSLSSTSGISGYDDTNYGYFMLSVKDSVESTKKRIYAAMPMVDDVKKTVLSLCATMPSTSDTYADDFGTFEVGVMNSPYDYESFVPVKTIVPERRRYNRYSVSFENYEGTGKFIALRGVNSKNIKTWSSSTTVMYAYFDVITLDTVKACDAPVGITSEVTDATASFTWKDNADKWNVKVYGKATQKSPRAGVYEYIVDEVDLISNTDVSEAAFAMKDLAPHTEYFVKIGTYCGADTLYAELVRIKTDCAAKGEALPYTMDFENCPSYGSSQPGNIPDCWSAKFISYSYSGESPSYYPYIYQSTSSTTSAHSGTSYLNFGCSSTSNEMFIALPKFDIDSVKDLQISLWIKGAGTAYEDTILVGVMEDPLDVKTFEAVNEFVVKGNVYTEFTLPFSNYSGKGEYIAIKKKKSDQHYYYIDDVKVKMLSNCGVKVSGAEATRLDNGTAFKWTAQDVANYELLIADKEIEDMENIPAETVLLRRVVSQAYDTVLNSAAAFASNTTYYAYIRTYCSAANTGDWSNVISFKTACLPATPESFGVEDFTNADRKDCWTVGIDKLVGNPTLTNPWNANNYLYLYNAKGTATSLGQTYAIMPTLDVEDIRQVEITFQAHCSTSQGILDLGICVDDYASYMYVDSIKLDKVSATTAATGYGFNEALYYTVRFTDYIGDAEGRFGKKIVFKGRGNTNALNYCYIKNVSLRYLGAINEPIHVTIPDSTIEVGSAIVNWDAQDGATGYEIKYSTAKIDPAMDTVLVEGEKAVIKTVTSATNSVKLTELPGLTMYYVYVRSIKGDEKSVWSNMRSFKSSCPVVFELPYSEDFDGYVSGYANYPDCWERYYTPASATSTTVTACVYSSAKNGTSGNGLYVGSILKYGPSYFALPKMNTAVKNLMMSFVYKSNSKSTSAGTSGGPNRYMAIGVASDVSTEEALKASVTWLDTIICSNSTAFTDYTFAFNEYAGTGEYIIFCGYGGNDARAKANDPNFSTTSTTVGGLYIDDLLIEKIPTCFPATVAFESATTSSLTISIADNFGQTAWDLALMEPGKEPVATQTVQLADTIQGGLFLIEGLPHSTTYDVYVRANCGNGDVSKWSKAVSMNTLVKLALDKAHWDFEYTDDERANYLVLSPKATSRSYLTDPTFTEGNANEAATYSYYPYLQPTSVPTTATAAMYGYKSDFSIRLYSTSSYPTQWFALPEIDGNLDTLQIRFDATSVYMSNRQTKALTTTYAKGTYPHSMKVGVMTDPLDWSTFSELGEFVFPEVTVANDTLIGDSMAYWNHYTINLFGAAAKGKFIAFATDYKATNYAYIDNIIVEAEQGCGAPSGLNIVDSTFTATSADVVWVSNKLKWNVQLVEEVGDSSIVVVDSVLSVPSVVYETRFALNDLKPNTSYVVRVQSVCSDTEQSEWTEKAFTTPCAAFGAAEAVWNFEDNLYQYGSSATYLIPQCWEVGGRYTNVSSGTITASSQTYIPYAVPNTASYGYAQGDNSTEGRALRFYVYSTTTNTYEAWAQMPALEKTEGMQLHFWGRASYISTLSTKKMIANSGYTKKLYFCTMEGEDVNTFKFVKLDSIEYTKTLTNSDLYTDDEDEYWQEFLVPLDKFNGKKVVIYAIGDNEKTSQFFIDNLEVLPDGYCFRPTNVKIDSIYSDRAKITWRQSSRGLQVQVASSEEFEAEAIIVDSIVNAANSSLQLTNLPAGAKLYYRTRSACGEEAYSDWNKAEEFQTLAKPLYRENFSALRLFPEGWTRYSKRMLNVVDSTAGTIGTPVSTTVTTNWSRYPTSIGLPAGHLKDNIYAASHNTWIVSERIDLTQIGENEHVALSFDLAMTDGKEHKGAEPDRLTGYDDAFVVAITLDNGATWSSEDVTVWANQPFAIHVDANTKDTVYVQPDYVYNKISSKFGGEKIVIDLSKYAGKIINFAFYGESSVNNADNDVHIGNVQINTYALNEYDETTCRWEDYIDANFAISVDEYNVGTTTSYQNYKVSNIEGGDLLAKLNLTVTEDIRSAKDTTLCEGTVYLEDNFNFVAEKSGLIQQKVACSNGCDSVSALNLTVIPKVYTDTVVSICHGKYFDFCGQQYYTSGNYECVYTSAVTGCDSIVRLHLTVREMIKGETQVYLCPDATIEFADTVITTPGVYSRIIDAAGCDSLATLTVIEAESDSLYLRAAIAEGDTYSKDPWRGISIAGDYPIRQENIYGCDSISILHLMVVPASGVLYDTITTNELPYVLDGEELLDVNTLAGDYPFVLVRNGVTFTLRVTVDNPQDVENVLVNTIAIGPNPVAVGQTAKVYGDFDNATVEVITSTGALAYKAVNQSKHIVIPGMPTAGVYLVRLIENGKVYQAKLIVK